MCQIIVKPENKKVDFEKLDKAQGWNSDGYGVTWWSEEDGIQTVKTMDYNMFKGVLSSLKKYKAVIHLRNTTKGTTCVDNNHPFDIKYGVMFHNGTISGLSGCEAGSSDTVGLAELINECEYTYITDIFPLLQQIAGDYVNRLVFMDTDGNIEYINKNLGMEEDGIWYSNDYHKRSGTRAKPYENKVYAHSKHYKYNPVTQTYEEEEEAFTKVFVYGTLKQGQGNHDFFLGSADFLGEATTVGKYAMVGNGMSFPYVLERDQTNGYNIKGEVYEVTKEELRELDRLEGYPQHYTKTQVYVSYNDGTQSENVTMYIKANVTEKDRALEYIDVFPKETKLRLLAG